MPEPTLLGADVTDRPTAPAKIDHKGQDCPRLALRPKDAARALGIGERLLWSMTNRGEIPHIKLGKAVLYPIAELERWLAERVRRQGGNR